MYCHKCGVELKDDAKFCHNCGQIIDSFAKDKLNCVNSTPDETNCVSQYALVRFSRTKSGGAMAYPAKIYIDGILVGKVAYGKDTTIQVDNGNHSLRLELNSGCKGGEDTIYVSPEQDSGFYTFKVAGLDCHTEVVDTDLKRGIQRPCMQESAAYAPVNYPTSTGPTCPKCGGIMTMQVVTESRKTGCGTIILYILLALTILGLLIVIPLMLRKKTETVTYSICQKCGYKRIISRR